MIKANQRIMYISVTYFCRWHGFRSVTQVCFVISILNFICMLLVAMAEAYWFSAMLLSKWLLGGPLGFFSFRALTSVWLWISSPNFSSTLLMWMEKKAFWFSDMSLSKWPPGGHIGIFGFQTLTSDWLWISNPKFCSTLPACIGK